MGRDETSDASFRLDVDAYRPGVAVLGEPCLTEDLRVEYEQVPEVVWLWLRRLFVTGRVGSVPQVQAQMKHILFRDLREELIHAYIWKHREVLHNEREQFLRALHSRMLERDIELCTDPAAERFERISDNLCLMLDAMITDAIDNRRWIQPKDVGVMVKALATLKEASTPLRTGRRGADGTGKRAGDDIGVMKGILDRLMTTQEGAEAEADDTLRKYIDRTKDILDPDDEDNSDD